MQLKNYSDTKTTIWQKLMAMSFVVLIVTILIGGIISYIVKIDDEDKEEILSNPGYTKGVLISKRTYKGKGADIIYWVNNKKNEYSSGISNEFYKKYSVGDSVEIVYSKKDPSKAILKYELKSSN